MGPNAVTNSCVPQNQATGGFYGGNVRLQPGSGYYPDQTSGGFSGDNVQSGSGYYQAKLSGENVQHDSGRFIGEASLRKYTKSIKICNNTRRLVGQVVVVRSPQKPNLTGLKELQEMQNLSIRVCLLLEESIAQGLYVTDFKLHKSDQWIPGRVSIFFSCHIVFC
jgi:hypothetical protein